MHEILPFSFFVAQRRGPMGRPAPSAVVLTGGYMRDGEGEGVVGIAVARPTGGQGRG